MQGKSKSVAANSIIETSFCQELVKIMRQNPILGGYSACSQARGALIDKGFDKEQIEANEEELSSLQDRFPIRGAVNPLARCAISDKNLYFLFITANRAKYFDLVGFTENLHGTTYYTIFGEVDAIMRMIGDKDSLEEIERHLGERSCIVRTGELVKEVKRYKFINVTSSLDKEIAKELRPELDKLSKDFSDDDVANEIKEKLVASGALLGRFVDEDFRLTRRVRAFVGMKLQHRRRVEPLVTHLLETERFLEVCSSLYICGEGDYHLLAELVVDDAVKLDEETDFLAGKMENMVGLEDEEIQTTTFVVAGSSERPVEFPSEVPKRIMVGGLGDMMEEYDALMSRFVGDLSPELLDEQKNLTQKEAISLLSALKCFADWPLDALPDEVGANLRRASLKFVEASLSKNVDGFAGAIISAKTATEIACEKTFGAIVSKCMSPPELLEIFQEDLDINATDWHQEIATMRDYEEKLRQWNESRLPSLFDPIPKRVLQGLSQFITLWESAGQDGEKLNLMFEDNFTNGAMSILTNIVAAANSSTYLSKNIICNEDFGASAKERLQFFLDLTKKGTEQRDHKEMLTMLKEFLRLSGEHASLLERIKDEINSRDEKFMAEIREILLASENQIIETAEASKRPWIKLFFEKLTSAAAGEAAKSTILTLIQLSKEAADIVKDFTGM